MNNRIALCITALAFSILGAACGGHKKTAAAATATNPEIRLANATKSATLTMNGVGVSDTTVTFTTSATTVGTISAYITNTTGQTYTIGVGATNGSLTASTQSLGLTAGVNYTLLAFERGGAINTYTLVDNQTVPASGFTSVLIANAGGDAGPLDVYLVASGANLNTVAPVFTGVAAKSTSAAKAITSGTYDVVVTANGKPTDVRLSIPAVVFASTDVVTIALTSTAGGSLVDGALVKQAGTMQIAPSTLAHVRTVGAFPPNGSTNSTVTVTIGAASLGALTAPSVGTYKSVTGGTSTYSVTVDGTAVASLPAATFANGGDYTVLVTGTPGAPVVNVLTDNNQPSVSGNANIRLVNAAVVGGITLTDNFVPTNVDVAYGQASDYSPAIPLNPSVLQLTSPASAFPGYTANNVNIVAGGVYTIFVLGSTQTPVVSLSKDR